MQYEVEDYTTFKIEKDGERSLLANFSARIIEETRYVDGNSTKTILTIAGEQRPLEEGKEPVKLPRVEVNAEQFGSLTWVMPAWGVRAVIRPGQSVKDDLRTAIQVGSQPKIMTVYRHIGWTQIDGRNAYLHKGGAIKRAGNDPTVRVELPVELSRYDLTTLAEEIEAGIKATLALRDLTKPDVAWSLIAATLAPLFGPVDFGVHLSGRTGTYKSEVMSLFQCHYGPGMDARHLPGSWSSTANALEAQAFLAKNAVFVIDDFVPTGTSWQQRGYQQNADKIIRAQGNQAGRARLTDVSELQATMYPRGIVFSTGEDIPEGHSVRARLMILELSPGDVDVKRLSAAQAWRKVYAGTVAALCQDLAQEQPEGLAGLVETLRTEFQQYGHSRTPGMLAKLVAVATWFIDWCMKRKVISAQVAKKLSKEARDSILAAGEKQISYLEEADPVDMFQAGIRQVLATGSGHLRTLTGGIPLKAEILGWTTENSLGELPTYKSRGPCIGWVTWNEDELFLDITAGYNVVKKVAGAEMTLTKNTLLKRLKDAGVLVRTDENRQRNTIRITAEQHPRQVLAMSLSATLQDQEIPNEESNDE